MYIYNTGINGRKQTVFEIRINNNELSFIRNLTKEFYKNTAKYDTTLFLQRRVAHSLFVEIDKALKQHRENLSET